MACSHCRGDETRQFCLVSNCVHTKDKTVLSSLDPVLMSPRWWCEHHRRCNKTVLSCLDPVLMSPRWQCEHNWRCNKTVLSGLQLCSHCQLDKTRQFCLVRVGGVNKPLSAPCMTVFNDSDSDMAMCSEIVYKALKQSITHADDSWNVSWIRQLTVPRLNPLKGTGINWLHFATEG